MRVLRSVGLWAVVLALATSESASGRGGKRVDCKDGKHTYNLVLPPSYETDKDRRFPVLFTNTPGAGGGTYGMENWARRNELILVVLNDTKNGLPAAAYPAAFSAVMGSVEADLRVHPCLRFSMGMSGGGWAAMSLASKYNDKFAGVCMLAHSGNGADARLAKHIAVAFVHGEKDTVHGASSARRVAKSLESRGHPVRIHVGDWGHINGPLDIRERFMDWMLERMRLTHPKLPPAERKAEMAKVKRRIEALSGVADVSERLRKADALFDVPGIDRWPEARKLRSAWFGAKYEIAQAEADPVAKHEALTDLSEDERVRRCDSKDRRKLSDDLRKMRSKSPCKEEWAARRACQQVAAFEKKAGKSKMRRTQAARSYDAVAKRYPDTIAGRNAAEAARRLVEAINSGKR